MRSTCVEHPGDVPGDFVQKFWIAPGADFYSFLTRLQENDLLFTIEVPADASDGPSVMGRIDEELRTRRSAGGPSLPCPSQTTVSGPSHRWELLSCKQTKVGVKNLRTTHKGKGKEKKVQNAGQNKGKQDVIEIKATSEMLSPVDYKISTMTKRYGFRNPLRSSEDEPEMLVVIGGCTSQHARATS